MTNITMLVANRPWLTKQALDSIGDLNDATVTIRDAGMSREVMDVISGWCGGMPRAAWRSVAEPLGTGPARNAAVQWSEEWFSRGEYLYLSDDDVYWLRPDWLTIMTTAYAEAYRRGFRVLGCYNHPFNRPIAPTTHLDCGHAVNEVYALATQSTLMRWSVWDEFGPFCDTPAGKVCQSEDVAFCNKIREAGYKVGVISPALLVNCGITNSFGEHIVGWELVKAEAPEGVIVE